MDFHPPDGGASGAGLIPLRSKERAFAVDDLPNFTFLRRDKPFNLIEALRPLTRAELTWTR